MSQVDLVRRDVNYWLGRHGVVEILIDSKVDLRVLHIDHYPTNTPQKKAE
jgi:hypothetical protein